VTVPAERFRLAAAVYGVLRAGDRVLLMRRAGSGYHDGELSLPAGHLDGGEDAVSGLLRELREELAITVDRDACGLVLVMHRSPEMAEDHEYLDLFFAVSHWSGTPTIGEPDKCSELVWANSAALPTDMISYVRDALDAVAAQRLTLLPYGWGRS
jgi:8-oxo-dGTP pyrophosphatase MutT (NUDIX family)